jgi:hypothetical protein
MTILNSSICMLDIEKENFIARLLSGSNICTDHGENANLVDDFYNKLLGSSVDR